MPKTKSMLEPDRIKRAQALISLGDSEYGDVLQTRFGDLGNELFIRSFSHRKNWKVTGSEKYQKLTSAFRYTSDRLSDLFVRLELLRLIVNETARIPEADRLAEMTKAPSEGNPWMWNQYASLAIKDFHTEISSVMDSVAPVAIQLEGEIKKKGKSPGFPAIRKGSTMSYRNTIPSDILGIIDETERWWPAVKEVRDVGIHREHYRIVFPTLGENDSLLFQFYEGHSPMIADPQLMYPDGKDVIDFSLYSGFIIAELLMFLDDLADPIANHLNIGSMTPAQRMGNFKELASSLDRLQNVITQPIL